MIDFQVHALPHRMVHSLLPACCILHTLPDPSVSFSRVGSLGFQEDAPLWFRYVAHATAARLLSLPESLLNHFRLRRACLFLLVIVFCLVNQQQSVQAQGNQPPEFAPVADREMYEGDRLQILISATDPDGDQIQFLIDSSRPLPSGATLIADRPTSALVEFEPTQAGVYTFVVVAQDNGTPVRRAEVVFTVTVKQKPQDYADVSIDLVDIESSASDGRVRREATFDYLVTVGNHGTIAATDVRLVIQLDGHLALERVNSSDVCTQAPTDQGKDEITCEFGTLQAQTTRTIEVTVLPITEGQALNFLTVTTTAQDLILFNNDLNHQFPVEPPLVDLALVGGIRIDGHSDYEVGDELVLDLDIHNLSQIGTEFTLSTTIPAGLTAVNTEGPGATPCQIQGVTVICRGTVGMNPVRHAITLRVAAQGRHVINATMAGAAPDPDTSNNERTVQVLSVTSVDLQVTLSLVDAQATYEVGDPIFMMMRVNLLADTAPAILQKVSAYVELPLGLALETIDAPTDVTCTPTTSLTTCTKLNMQTGDSFAVLFTLRGLSSAVWRPKAFVQWDDELFVDTYGDNNEAVLTVTVLDPVLVDLSVTNVLQDGSTDVGAEVRFQIVVENHSNSANRYDLTIALSAGLDYMSVENTPGILCTTRGQTISCADLIGPNSTRSYILSARVIDDGIQGTTATVASLIPDPNLTNNDAQETFLAVVTGDLRVGMILDDEQNTFEVGDLIFTALQVAASATWNQTVFAQAEVINEIPAGLAIVQVDEPPDVDCEITNGGRKVSCEKSNMQAGEEYEVAVVLQAVAPGTWLDRAFVPELNYSDVLPLNNRAQLTIVVQEPVIPYIYIHTFEDRNGNGIQDPGEVSFPGFYVDTSVINDGNQQQVGGTTDGDGLLKLAVGDRLPPDELRVTTIVTPTAGMTPTISLLINSVPPTGQASISGANACGMTVHQTDGSNTRLPCTDENTLAWVDQIDASIATFRVQLAPTPPQAAGQQATQADGATVTFTISATQNQMIYLPLIVSTP